MVGLFNYNCIKVKGVQGNLIEEGYRGAADPRRTTASTAWVQAQRNRQYNTSLKEILATMGENGERRITWDFDKMPRTPLAIMEKELGNGENTTGIGRRRLDGMLHR